MDGSFILLGKCLFNIHCISWSCNYEYASILMDYVWVWIDWLIDCKDGVSVMFELMTNKTPIFPSEMLKALLHYQTLIPDLS